MTKPTVDDVAALAGVARSSVSRALNNHPNVRPELRDKVMRAVEMLGYRVNIQARSLAGGKILRFALFHAVSLDTEPNSYFQSALELGATRASAKAGCQLITHAVNQQDENVSRVVIQLVRDDQCDGVILTPPFADDPELLGALAKLDCKIACVSPGPDTQDLASNIGIDEYQGGYDVGMHLLAAGHRQFGFIKGLAGHAAAELRFEGFLAALEEAGLGAANVAHERGDFTFRSGRECARRLLQSPMTALVCANDDMAAGALLAAHQAGRRIPQDLAVTGFDDTPISEIVWPPLTTVHQPLRQMGERAVERLLAMIGSGSKEPEPIRETLPHRLVVRDSTVAAT
jgi:LacI family transcriptional regulator